MQISQELLPAVRFIFFTAVKSLELLTAAKKDAAAIRAMAWS